MHSSPSSTTPPRPRPHPISLGVGLGLAALFAAGWHFADALVWAPPVRRRVPRTRVLRVDGAPSEPPRLTLTRNRVTVRPGVLGLEWDGEAGTVHHAQLGPVLSGTPRTVTRAVRVQDAPLQRGQRVRPSVFGLGTPASLGLAYRDVLVPAEHGPMPAWLVPGGPGGEAAGTDWVIVTHGFKGLRQDALRLLPALARLGLSSLTITYRNAHGAPRTPQGVYRLSAEEWQDLEAAVGYARACGARRLLLLGFSMGGGISLAFLRHSPLAPLIRGVVLDSPPLEWRSLIRHYARRYRLPPPCADAVEWLTVVKSGQDFDAVDHLRAAGQFSTPMLLLHGDADTTVPAPHARRLAHARPDLVEYHCFEGAEHVRAWNVDPERYEALLSRFVRRVLEGPPAGRGEEVLPEHGGPAAPEALRSPEQ